MITIRHAKISDAATLDSWDTEPHVISATTDDPHATEAYEDLDWAEEIAASSDLSRYWIAELDGRPIGVMQIIDPHSEPTHYWGDVEPNQRALDIWIGSAADLGKGYGDVMMRQGLAVCFADPAVTAVLIDPLASNVRAHKFYQRFGFQAVGLRTFHDESVCLVYSLSRASWRASDYVNPDRNA